MATQPLENDPSGPETEYSQSENVQDLAPVLVLRTAQSLILPLRIPDQWEEQPFASAAPSRSIGASPVVAFKATTQVLDPGTQRSHAITLSIGPGIDDGSANVFLQSDSIRNEGSWRAYLYRGTELRAGVPFADGYVELHRGLPAGIYTIKLTSAGAPVLPALTVALQPFNLPEALQVGETYLTRRQYIRAAAVLSETAERYPENADAQDLLVLAGRTLDASTVSDAVLTQSAEAMVSTAVLRSLILLKENLEIQKSAENQPLLRVLGIIASRQEHLKTLNGELTK